MYPVRVVVSVTVEEVFAARPVTVISPEPLTETEPPADAVPAQVKAASKLEIWTVNPSVVAVGEINEGVSAAAADTVIATVAVADCDPAVAVIV
jgi:hypothetical protein